MKRKISRKWIWIGIVLAVISIAYYIIFYSEFSPVRIFCLKDDDCRGTCDCGCINKYMYCSMEILCELGPRPCECFNNRCLEYVESYIACGCGCCVGEEPIEECLYRSKGDNIHKIIEEDKKLAQSPICPTVGCAFPINYIYCD